MSEWHVTNNSTGESFTVVEDDGYYSGTLSRPKRNHRRKKVFVLFRLVAIASTSAPIIMSVMAGLDDGKILDNLLMNWPFIFVGVLMLTISGIMLRTINKTVNRINKIDFEKSGSNDTNEKNGCEKHTLDAEKNPYGLCQGENINYKNNVPLDVLDLLDANKDKHLLKAVELAKVKYYEYQHREEIPKKEWLKYRENYIQQQGHSYDGEGEVCENGFGARSEAPFGGKFGDRIGVKWEDIDGNPRFYRYPLYENFAEFQSPLDVVADQYTVIFRDRDCVPLDMLIDSCISIRYGSLLVFLKKLVWSIYPLFILSIILHALHGNELLNAFLLSFNTLGLLCTGVAIYKNFASLSKLIGSKKAIVHSVIAYFASGLAGIGIISIISDSFYILNSTTLCMAVICDIILMTDIAISKYNKSHKASANDPLKYTPPIHWTPILIISITGILLLGTLVLGISITIPEILEEITAFDNGTSTNLTKTLIFWGVGFAISIALSVGAALLVNFCLQKRDIKHHSREVPTLKHDKTQNDNIK